MKIKGMAVADFKAALKAGQCVWPGGYPQFAVTADCAALCFKCLKKEKKEIVAALKAGLKGDDQWRVIGIEVNWEDPWLYCDNCNDRIESAYAEDEAEEAAEIAV